jgi:hypothetical protein
VSNGQRCSCMFPAVQWDREICESVGGTCLPEEFLGATSVPGRVTQGTPAPECPPRTPYREAPTSCDRPPVQRVMHIPFELCPDYEEWVSNRYVWEE